MDSYLPKPFHAGLSAAPSRRVGGGSAAANHPAPAGDQSKESPPAVLDPRYVAELCSLGEGSGIDLMSELAQVFARDTPVRLDHLKNALHQGDASLLRAVAHTLKGTASGVGATKATAVCARLEAAAGDGDMESAGVLVAEAEDELGRVGGALESLAFAPRVVS